MFMLIGIFLCSPISGIWTFLGSILGILISMLFGISEIAITSGLYGYNSSLVGIAIGGFFIIHRSELRSWYVHICLTILSIVVTPIVTSATSAFFSPMGIPALTWPFTIVTWIIVLSATSIPAVQCIEIEHLSCPEDHIENMLMHTKIENQKEQFNDLENVTAVAVASSLSAEMEEREKERINKILQNRRSIELTERNVSNKLKLECTGEGTGQEDSRAEKKKSFLVEDHIKDFFKFKTKLTDSRIV